MDATPQAHPSLYSTQGLVIPLEMRSEILLSKMSCHELREIEMSGHGVIRRIFSKNVA